MHDNRHAAGSGTYESFSKFHTFLICKCQEFSRAAVDEQTTDASVYIVVDKRRNHIVIDRVIVIKRGDTCGYDALYVFHTNYHDIHSAHANSALHRATNRHNP